MSRLLKLILFLLIATTTIIYINHGISTYNMSFYSGKDNGYFLRFESIFILSSLYFVLMTNRNKILDGLIGLAIGFIWGMICYIITMLVIPDPFTETFYSVFSCFMFMLTYYMIENYRTRKNNSS